MAYPVRKPSLAGRLLSFLVAGGLGYIALHFVAYSIRTPDYLGFLFGLLFIALAGIAIQIGSRE